MDVGLEHSSSPWTPKWPMGFQLAYGVTFGLDVFVLVVLAFVVSFGWGGLAIAGSPHFIALMGAASIFIVGLAAVLAARGRAMEFPGRHMAWATFASMLATALFGVYVGHWMIPLLPQPNVLVPQLAGTRFELSLLALDKSARMWDIMQGCFWLAFAFLLVAVWCVPAHLQPKTDHSTPHRGHRGVAWIVWGCTTAVVASSLLWWAAVGAYGAYVMNLIWT